MNDKKWNKYTNEAKFANKIQEFLENARIFIQESTSEAEIDEISQKMDEILENLSEKEQKELNERIISEICHEKHKISLEEIEPYQKIIKKEHPRWKKRLIGLGINKDKSSPYKTKPSMKRGKSAPPSG